MSWETIINDNNLDVSIIDLSKISLFSRIDAEHYLPEYFNIEKKISKHSNRYLDDFSDEFIHPNEIKREFVESGILFLRTQNLRPLSLEFNNEVYISTENSSKLKKSLLKFGDILITRTGANFGQCSIYQNEKEAVIASSHVLILRVKNINPFYITAFLNSSYGRKLVNKAMYGAVQPEISPTFLRKIVLPVPTDSLQVEIQNLIIESKILKDGSQKNYEEAEHILLKQLGLDKYVTSELSVSVRDLTECLRDDRFDAEYWQPEYDEMEKAVAKVTQKELGEIVSVSKGIEVGSEAYSSEGKPFIRVSDFSIYGIEDVEKKISPELYEELKDKYSPKKGEVLFTKDGTIGLSYALHEDTFGIMSGAFLRLKPTIKINIDYLTLVLNSLYCKTQIDRMSGGAIIAHLKPESAKKIKIPLLSDIKQVEIAEKVSTAFRMRKEALELLSKAKHAVEVFIEKDGVEALKYLNL